MAITRIKNNQITDSTIVASSKLVDNSVSAGKLADNLVYSSNLTVTGNLTVQGSSTTLDTINTLIEDPILLLAKDQVGAPVFDIGFVGERGDENNIAWIWDESDSRFKAGFTTADASGNVITLAGFADAQLKDLSIAGLAMSGNITSGLNVDGAIVGATTIEAGTSVEAPTLTDGTLSINAGSITGGVAATFSGSVEGGTITDGTMTSTAGVMTGVVSVAASGNVDSGNVNTTLVDATTLTASGTVTGGTLTDGTLSSTAGTITGGVAATFSGSVEGGTITDGTMTSTAGVMTGVVSVAASGNVDSGNVNTTLVDATTVTASGTVTGGTLTDGTLSSTAGTITGGVAATFSGAVEGGTLTDGTLSINAGSITGGVAATFSGNVTGGNLVTAGAISAASISATGNVTGGNIVSLADVTTVSVTASGTVTGGTITDGTMTSTAGVVTGVVSIAASGNVDSGNVNTTLVKATTVTASGTVTGGTLTDGTLSSTAGTITGGVAATFSGAVEGGTLTDGTLSSTAGTITGGVAATFSGTVQGATLTATGNVNAALVNTTDVVGSSVTLTATGTDQNIVLAPSGTGTVDASGARLTGVATPVNNTDGANKLYVDNLVQGLDIKASVVAGTLTALASNTYNNGASGVGATLTGTANGAFETLDGVTLVVGERVLVKNEAAQANNGIYVLTDAGSAGTPYILTRATDMDNNDPSGEFPGAFTFIEEGTVQEDSGWVCITDSPVTVGTTAIVFEQFSGAGSIVAGDGLSKAGNELSVNVDEVTTTITADAVVVKAGAQFVTPNIGAATGTSLTATGAVEGATLTDGTLSINAGTITGGVAGTFSGTVEGGTITDGTMTSTAGVMTGVVSVAASGNVDSGNVNTTLVDATTVTASGTVTGGTVTDGTLSINAGSITGGVAGTFSGNVTAGNLVTAGAIAAAALTATGNVTGGNIVSQADVTTVSVTASGTVQGATLTDGTLSSTAGTITGGVAATFSGSVEAGTLTDGTLSSTAGTITGGVAATFSGTVEGGTITDGTMTSTAGVMTGVVSIAASGNVDSGNVNTTLVDATTLTASGTVTGGTLTDGTLSSTAGTITGGVAATFSGNVDSGNVNTVLVDATTVTASGTVTGGTVTDGTLSINAGAITGGVSGDFSANVDSGNVNTGHVAADTVTAGNITINTDSIDSIGTAITLNTDSQDVDVNIENSSGVAYVQADAATSTVVIGAGGTQTTDATLKVSGTDSMMIPVGTSLQRPAVPVTGMTRFNTTLDSFEFYDSNSWTTAGADFTVIASETFAGDDTTVAFTLQSIQTTASCIVSINGVLQLPTTAYGVSGTTLTFTEAPATGDVIEVREVTTTTTITLISNGDQTAIIEAVDSAAEVQITGDLLPAANVTQNLGSDAKRWNELFLAGTTITLGNVVIKNTGGNAIGFFGPDGTTPGVIDDAVGIVGDSIQSGSSIVDFAASSGNVQLTAGGVVAFKATTDGANVTGNLTASGNIAATNFIGNGSQLTGIDATQIQNGTSNVAVANNADITVARAGALLATFGTAGLTMATGNVAAAYFTGNGSLLTGIDATAIQNGTTNVSTALNSDVTVTRAGALLATFGTAGLTLASGNFVGNASTATVLATARNIGGVSFNGAADINLPGVNAAGNQNTTGSAATLTTARAIALSGDVTGTANFDGSAGITISATIAANSVALGTDTTGNYVATIAGTANEVEVTGSGSETAGVTVGLPNDVTISNDLTVSGNLTVNGTTVTVNVATLAVEDKDIVIAKNATTSGEADGAGLIIGSSIATLLYASSGDRFTMSKPLATSLIGNADTATLAADATKLATTRAIQVSGAVTGTANFDGSAAINIVTTNTADPTITLAGDLTGSVTLTNLASGTLTATIAANSVALGTDTTGNYVGAGAVSGSGLSGSLAAEGGTFTVASNATDANTANTIVFRNASGNFSAGTISATATAAQYADLAEMYAADADIEAGTVVHFVGEGKVAECDAVNCRSVAGIISTDPAHLMNVNQAGVALSLAGRVPTKVSGAVKAGDLMVSAGNGRAMANNEASIGTVIGKALEDHEGGDGVIEVLALMM